MNDEKLSLLAKWASGLQRDTRAEVAAAGRAIAMLIDEVERLNVLMWEGPLNRVPTTLEPQDDGAVGPEDLAQRLRARLEDRMARPE